MSRVRIAALVLWAAWAVACDDGAPALESDIGRPDAALPVTDAALARDAAVAPDASLGQPCADGADCPSGFCVAYDDGRRVCSARCGNDDDCPDDWLCRQVSNAGPDVTFICVPEASPCGGVDLATDPDHCGACGERCAYAFAEALCIAGACAMGPCLEGHHDLDGDPASGCEYACTVTRDGEEVCDEIDNDCDGALDEDVDLATDVEHCGACGTACVFARATAFCDDGVCRIAACEPGWTDADGDPENGCESDPCAMQLEVCDGQDNDCDGAADEDFDLGADVEHCGGCGMRCVLGDAIAACEEGVCVIGECHAGFVDLDGMPENGCECRPAAGELCNETDDDCDGMVDEGFELGADVEHCGGCGMRCVLDDAIAACLNGGCVVGECRAGFVDLDGMPENGCECRSAAGGEQCNGVDDDCDGAADEDFDLGADVEHCGGCGMRCALDDAIAACAQGMCVIDGCRDGFVDRDGIPANGCECRPAAGGELCNGADDDCDGAADEGFDLLSDLRHCGLCNAECRPDNAEPVCIAGRCAIERCRPGAVDLDGAPENGCEYLCRPTGEERCNGLDDDCDGATDEGIDVRVDPMNCGACGQVCGFANAAAACVEGLCRVGDCDAGFVDLDGAPGCEYACAPTGAEVCDGGRDEDCDGAVDEGFDRGADPANCGVCGRVCAFANATGLCVEGDCVPGDCDAGFFDLDGIPGCEYACVPAGVEVCDEIDDDCDGTVDEGFDLDADPVHCGRCGRSCAAERAETACVDGDCRLVACAEGFVDLDGDLQTGCEYACVPRGVEDCDEVDDDCDGMVDEGFDLQGDPDNCGLCGLGCGFLNALALCVEGRCTAGACDPGFVDLDDVPGCEYACTPSVDGAELCNGADDDCDGIVDERVGPDGAPLPECEADRSGGFLVEADPDEQLVGGLLPIQFIPAILSLDVQPPDVSGSMDGPDGRPIVYAGGIDGDAMELTASYVDPAGLQHDETWEVVWTGVDRFDGIMTDRMTLPGFGLFDVIVWNVSGVRP